MSLFSKSKPENTTTPEELKERIIACLRNIYDPEIPVNIYDLGLIYNIDIDAENNVKVLMTMTAPDCPEAEYMFQEVKSMIRGIKEVKSVEVELTFNPPWDYVNLSDEVKLELGLM
ncbi:MAG: DUF59 domain-containing protein [Bacteroidales bacterium]|nr:DUF59 domain-containing protein [Bacteroidales bacterium]